MIDWLSEAAGLYKSNPYIIQNRTAYTFNDINERAKSIAHFLQNKHDIKNGDIAAVLSDNNIDFILLIFALWKLGAIPVPLNIRLNDSETNGLLNFLKPDFIFIAQGKTKDLLYQGAKIIGKWDDSESQKKYFQGNEDIPAIDFSENDIALIMFTSGSSGIPKGVEISFRNLKASFLNSNTVLDHKPGDKWIASLPFYHIGGFSIIIRTLLSGTTLIIPASLQTDDIVHSIKAHCPAFISLVSTQLRRLINLGIKPWQELRYAILGGGHIEDSLIDEAINLGWRIAKVYGSTETSSFITFVDCNKDESKKTSGGKPLANNQIFIMKERKKMLSNNVWGK